MEETALDNLYDLEKDFYDPANAPFYRAAHCRVHLSVGGARPPDFDIIDQSSNPTGATGAAGDYFAANSVDAYWWPAQRKAAAADTVNCPALLDNAQQRLAKITDGLSNTLLLAEFAGRPDHWIMGVKQLTNANLQWANWWGPWASYQGSIFKTWSADGLTPQGPCTINCNNNWGIYAFHPAGANALFCDGSVHFLVEGLDRDIFASIVTKAGGEIFEIRDL